MPSSLAALARKKLLECIADIDTRDEYTLEDTLRAFQEESHLLAITEQVRSQLVVGDEPSYWKEHAATTLQVVDYHKTATRDDYVQCLATVALEPIRLFFCYERRPCDATVSYTIDIAAGSLRKTILWVQIRTAANGPTPNCILLPPFEEEESANGDVKPSEPVDKAQEPVAKKQKVEEKGPAKDAAASDQDEEPNDDMYTAGVDPSLFSLLDPLLTVDTSKDENFANVCSLLMRFPFYEGEWDLSGMLFDAIFDDEGSHSSRSAESDTG